MNSKATLPATPLSATGKEIRVLPSVEPQIAILKTAARQGYYYPMLALKQLASLSAGPLGKHNVFIPNVNSSKAHTLQMFCIFLPGIKATIERRANDTYMVTKLELSDGYAGIGKDDRPGIYSVSKEDQGYRVKYKSNGRITPEDGRTVIICESGYRSPGNAAKDVASRLQETAGRAIANRGEFDIFYSGLDQGLGGNFRNYDPKSIKISYAAASVLADAMAQSRNKKGVNWISEFGGSAIFTQAMHILNQQQLSFNDQNHSAYLYEPKTNPVETLSLTHKLGLDTGKDFTKGGNTHARLSTLKINWMRASNNNSPYTWKDYSNDTANSGLKAVAIGGAGIFAAGFLPMAAPVAVAVGTAGSVVSGIGAAHLLWTTSKNVFRKIQK